MDPVKFIVKVLNQWPLLPKRKNNDKVALVNFNFIDYGHTKAKTH